jgi:hypothetical protein
MGNSKPTPPRQALRLEVAVSIKVKTYGFGMNKKQTVMK